MKVLGMYDKLVNYGGESTFSIEFTGSVVG